MDEGSSLPLPSPLPPSPPDWSPVAVGGEAEAAAAAILKQVSNMANAGSGALASFLFFFVFPAALHKGKGLHSAREPPRTPPRRLSRLCRAAAFQNPGSCAPERACRGCAMLLSNSEAATVIKLKRGTETAGLCGLRYRVTPADSAPRYRTGFNSEPSN